MKKKLVNLLLSLTLLIGVGLLLYPTVSDYWNSFHQSRAIASYAESIHEMDSALYEEMWRAAGEYNRSLRRAIRSICRRRSVSGTTACWMFPVQG